MARGLMFYSIALQLTNFLWILNFTFTPLYADEKYRRRRRAKMTGGGGVRRRRPPLMETEPGICEKLINPAWDFQKIKI